MSIKDFSIVEKLGQGAYSIVYKVQRLADKGVYALKKVKLGSLSEKQIQNALNQVRILASIKNQYIVGYKQVFLQGKTLCIVMEFLDDGDLYQKIVEQKKKKALFEQKQIWSVFIQIVMGLKTLHSLNIHHRDLKSANVFLTKSGEAKLGDMNVSKIAKSALLYTQTGTPYYASPQVWRDEPYDLKSDIWSLGCVIYQMATLQPPFKAQDMEGLFKSVTTGNYQPISSAYSKQLAHIIKLMLQQKPKARPSADKIINSSLIQKKIQELSFDLEDSKKDQQMEMLRTIRVPKNLSNLTERLPKPNYDDETKDSRSPSSLIYSRQQSKESINKESISNKNSLPKLSQLLRRNVEQTEKKKKKKSKPQTLVIEGRSKIIEEARGYEKQSKNLQKEIRQQLRKIYKVRDAKSEDRQNHKKNEKSQLLPPIKL